MVRRQILDRFAIDSAKVEVIHNGVEWKEMEKDFKGWETGRTASLSKWNLDPNCFHFLFIGNGYLRKGLDPLLEAMARLPNREIHLSVVGKDKRISFYQEKCKKLGLQNRVRFFGPQKEIRPFYQLADALAIPSFYDPFANVTVEALAMGLWVISSKTNGGHEILTPNNGAIIDNLLDVESVKDALLSALSRPKTSLSALAARRSVESFDFSRQLNTLMDACWPSER
jgi:UDP-glucose:(heptosyl)LPS alpha-1,3-glucosyltransferase